MSRNPLKVGDAVYVLPADRHLSRFKGSSNLLPATVTSVGRKYFTIEGEGLYLSPKIKFNTDNWTEVTDYSPSYYLYESVQERQDELDDVRIRDIFHEVYSGKIKLTIEQLRQIESIIKT